MVCAAEKLADGGFSIVAPEKGIEFVPNVFMAAFRH